MTDQEKIILSFIFNRSGKSNLKESDIYLPLSLELGWFSLQQAKEFVKKCIQHKNLEVTDGLLSPSFDIDTIVIPTGFYPVIQKEKNEMSDNKQPPKQSVAEYIEHITKRSGKTNEEIKKEIQDQQREKNMIYEVAALSIANIYGVDSSQYYGIIEKSIFTENE